MTYIVTLIHYFQGSHLYFSKQINTFDYVNLSAELYILCFKNLRMLFKLELK